MRKKRKELTRTAAMFLASLLTVNSIDLPAFTADGTYVVYAAQAEDVSETTKQAGNADKKEATGHKVVAAVTGFAGLEERITNQQLAVGAGEEEIVFPDRLDVTVSVSFSEETDEAETKEITLTDIAWELNIAESDGDTFDSSEDCDGYCYVYTPVLPETDADGNTLVLGENVENPKIYVLIGESEEHINLIDEVECGDFIISGEDLSSKNYSYSDGILTIKTDKKITIRNINPDVSTTNSIIVKKNANITLAGVNIDVSSMEDTIAFKSETATITLENGTTNVLKSGEHCAGLQVMASKTAIVIDGSGTLNAIGGDSGAGIGGGSMESGGIITINGGSITATGGDSGAGGTVTITGGNIQAKGKNAAEDIGHGKGSTDSGTLKDGNGNDLYLHTITLCGLSAETEITSITGVNYSMTDVKTLDTNKLYLYLPASAEVTGVDVGTERYIGNLAEQRKSPETIIA